MLEVALGPEYDVDLRHRLIEAARTLGGMVGASNRAMGGSQEVETYQLHFSNGTVAVREETYLGLVLKGDAELVNALVVEIRKPA